MRHLLSDLRFGLRLLIQHPTLSVAAVLTFGLGIGLTATVFSVVNGALFKGLPFRGADRLMAVAASNVTGDAPPRPLSVHDSAVWKERQTVFDASGEVGVTAINLAVGNEQPQRYTAGQLTAGAFEALGVAPALGRGFRAGEDQAGADPVILLGYEVWRDAFGSSPDAVGRTVRANGQARTVIGVMPEGFAFPVREQLWVPLVVDPLATPRGRGPAYLFLGRLKPGVSAAEANAQAAAVFARLEEEHPDTNKGLRGRVMPYTEQFLGPQLHALLYTMLGAGIGVLLIACVNVSNLLLARASLRQREVAIRLAIGASRTRVVTQFLTEVGVLAAGGAALGLLLSAGAMRWFVSAIQVNPPPFWITFETDHRVLLFVLAVTAAAGLVAGFVPALQATSTNVAAAVKDDSRSVTGLRIGRLSAALVVVEVAVSCGLLVAAGLMIKSVVQLRNVPMPFAVENILTARINLPASDYPDEAARIRFYEQLLPRLQAAPGVEAATLSDGLPAAGNGALAIAVDGQTYPTPQDYPVVREGIVTPGYFETFQTPVLQGRTFTVADRADSQMVAIVNDSFARAYFKDGATIGRRIRKRPADGESPWLTVVGVVPDLLMEGIGNSGASPAGYYIPIAQSDVATGVRIAVRSRGEPGAFTGTVRTVVASLDANLAIFEVSSMRDVIRRQTGLYWIFGSFFMAFGAAALFLAVVGLYGVVSFSVTERTREIGIRTALGAQGRQLIALVMRRSIVQLVVGLALGAAVGLLASGPLGPLLYRVEARDPWVLVTVPVVLAAASLAASFLPARRAARVDPVIALAAE